MDPASVLALVASGLTVTTKTLKNLNEVAHHWKGTEQSVQLLAAKLSTVRAALSQLQMLFDTQQGIDRLTPQLETDLTSAMLPCTIIINAIDRQVCQLRAGWLKGRLRYLFDEGLIKEHSVHLDSQITALNLLLQVIQMSSSNDRHNVLERRVSRRILQRAHDDASSYITKSSLSFSPSQADVEFEFDDQLIDSAAYRSAFRKYTNLERASKKQITIREESISEREIATLHVSSIDNNSFKAIEKPQRISQAPRPSMRLALSKGWKFRGSPLTRRERLYLRIGIAVTIVIAIAIIVPAVVVFMRKKASLSSRPKNGSPSSPSTSPFPSGFPIIPLTAVSLPSSGDSLQNNISGCASPPTLWSCYLPKEQQASGTPTQPSFNFTITLRNGSDTPSPVPPSQEDQIFLGNTTDSLSAPFNGEDTPLLITFEPEPSQQQLKVKRQNSEPTNITDGIPPPAVNSDGTAAPAVLVPVPVFQPLRLYDRGLKTEHYGFYTYFDKSIFLNLTAIDDSTDRDGGALFSNATHRCTWAQTRFHVQIYTQPQNHTQSTGDSAADFGLEVTLSIDRHGGEADKKMIYCYEIEDDRRILNGTNKSSFMLEDRSFEGALINHPGGRNSVGPLPDVTGPIDGGTGGCGCVWKYTPNGSK